MRSKELVQLLRIGFSGLRVRPAGQNHVVERTGIGRAEYRRIEHRHVLPASVRQVKFERHSPCIFRRIGSIRVATGNREPGDDRNADPRKQLGAAQRGCAIGCNEFANCTRALGVISALAWMNAESSFKGVDDLNRRHIGSRCRFGTAFSPLGSA